MRDRQLCAVTLAAASVPALLYLPRLSFDRPHGKPQYIRPVAKRIFAIAAPLSLCRMMLCILQAIEAALLPQQLQRYGLSASDALSCYGILSGMVLPLLLFPTAVTGSFGMLLLPLISEAQTLRHESRIVSVSRISFFGSLLLGLFFLPSFSLRRCRWPAALWQRGGRPLHPKPCAALPAALFLHRIDRHSAWTWEDSRAVRPKHCQLSAPAALCVLCRAALRTDRICARSAGQPAFSCHCHALSAWRRPAAAAVLTA